MARVFISYARESEGVVRSLAEDIEALEHTAWFDHDLSGGKPWWDQILARIRDCEIFMMVLSRQSLDSLACKREYNYAADLGKPILPILGAEDVSVKTLPPRLSEIEFVNYCKQDRASAFKLANALKGIPPAPALPSTLPEPPAVPLSYLGTVAEQIDSDRLDDSTQHMLISDLRRALREPETAADARGLLTRLRKRDDLRARAADEIDELLESSVRADPVTREAPRTTGAAPVSPDERPLAAPAPSASKWPSIMHVAVGAIVGAAAGGLLTSVGGQAYGLAMVTAIGGAITGAISRSSGPAILLAVVVGILASVVVVYDGGSPRDIVSMIAGVALPGGAIFGAVIGRVLTHVLHRRRAT